MTGKQDMKLIGTSNYHNDAPQNCPLKRKYCSDFFEGKCENIHTESDQYHDGSLNSTMYDFRYYCKLLKSKPI
jgi:hypothetical protein